jgi:hypothetical protein
MTYFATAFTLSICGIRLRFRLDFDDEPEPAAAERPYFKTNDEG